MIIKKKKKNVHRTGDSLAWLATHLDFIKNSGHTIFNLTLQEYARDAYFYIYNGKINIIKIIKFLSNKIIYKFNKND